MISPIHTKVPGRARYKVTGLQSSEMVKRHLEQGLSQRKEISSVSASTVTGNVLVCYDDSLSHETIASILHDIAVQVQEKMGRAENRARAAIPVEKRADIPSNQLLNEDDGWRKKLKDKMPRFLLPYEEQRVEQWHLAETESIVEILDTQKESGLTSEAVAERLKRYGPNLLPESAPRSKWSIFVDQFLNLPVALLGAAAGLSIVTGGLLDAAVIAGVVVANGFIGFATESKAEKTFNSLKNLVHPTAKVIRDGKPIEIPAEGLVVGDIFTLKPGTYVAADCRIVEASNVSVDESALTGESMPVVKDVSPLREHVALADRVNMAYMGTLVTGGEGLAVVIATGRYTEIGRLQALLEETTTPETPIERQLSKVGDQLVLLGGAICGIVGGMGLLRGYGFLQMLRMAVSLAAAAVPEGLPAAATVNLALGIDRMKSHNILIRHLQSVETLGAIQTICLDKTGTLTMNRMAVVEIASFRDRIIKSDGHFFSDDTPMDPLSSEELKWLISLCVLCNESKIINNGEDGHVEVSGTSTENALIYLAVQSGLNVKEERKKHPLLKIHYRAENRLFMGTLHETNNGERLYAVKGSPPAVLSMCDWLMKDGERVPLTEEDQLEIERKNQQMAGEALRVLAVAYANPDSNQEDGLETGLTWVGLVGMMDPVREGVKELIHSFHQAGIDTVMITGDQSATAYAVARRLGISRKEPLEILESTELATLDSRILQALAEKVHVYTRVSPAQKLQIVQALQSAGKVVAMTGDGINDGPALKAADIGIAMGASGADVARDVADVILKEDELEKFIVAIRDGRTTYANIKKSVHFFLSTNLSEIMVMMAATAAGIGMPLNVMQLLWINIISDIFPGLALSMEEAESDVLEQPPRDPNEPILSKKDFKRMILESAVISGSSLGAYTYGMVRYGMGARATSLAFQSLTIGQLLHALSCRSERHTIFDKERPQSNIYLNIALGGSLIVQILTMIIPGLRRFLGVTPLGLLDAGVIGGSAVLSLLVNEATKKKAGGKP